MNLYRRICPAALSLGLALATPAYANEVVFEITPLGSLDPDIIESLQPIVEPTDLVGDLSSGASFDASRRQWLVPLGQLSEYSTRVSLQLEGGPSHFYPERPLNLSLPYRSQRLKIVIPALDSFDSERLRAVYRNEELSATAGDVLNDFVHVTMQIDYLTDGQLPDTIDITPTLARSLVIYGNSMARLIDGTEWFGVPADFFFKRALMQNALYKAETNDRFADEISVERLLKARDRADAATHAVYRRYYVAIADLQSDIQCNEIFPISLPFYKHLRDVSSESYVGIREEAGFTRSMVLNETVRCFNRLLSIRDGARFALESVVDSKFDGLGAIDMHALLTRYLAYERSQIIREAGAVESVEDPCIPPDITSESAQTALSAVCDDIAWLSDIRPSIERGVENVRN